MSKKIKAMEEKLEERLKANDLAMVEFTERLDQAKDFVFADRVSKDLDEQRLNRKIKASIELDQKIKEMVLKLAN